MPTPPSQPGSPRAGRWEKSPGPEPFFSFIPAPLPPNPPIRYDLALQDLEERANRALGRLDAITALLPDPRLFLYTYVRKEAVLSSQIEGTQSSLSDLLAFENQEYPGVQPHDAQEVSNYVTALEHGISRSRKDGFPISLRLIREIHAILLKDGRGADKEPGEFRTSSNWIGGTRPGNAYYVPPPSHEVLPALGHLEKFLHNMPAKTPTLLKAGLAHAQFESIHPFLDGNGRLGRLLITFILCNEGALAQPLLYLSLYFKTNRKAYYDHLQRIRTDGDWEGWLIFFLEGVEAVSREATSTAHDLLKMFETHRKKIQTLGKAAVTALRLHDLLKERAVVSTVVVEKHLKVSFPSASSAIANLGKLGLVKEITGRKTGRLFSYAPYLAILTKGTELP
jgi:Fic family protein